jgi:hypothetical protein
MTNLSKRVPRERHDPTAPERMARFWERRERGAIVCAVEVGPEAMKALGLAAGEHDRKLVAARIEERING